MLKIWISWSNSWW